MDTIFLKCSGCGKADKTVARINCGYQAEVNENPNCEEIVCEDCEHEHLMDI